jgi:transcriptional regulator with XRE-family HTH domain
MRTTTSSHPLARLRAIVGWTREECARVSGMTSANVQNVELGRSSLPEEAAARIQAATGCAGDSLLAKSSRPLAFSGKVYTREIFEQWTTHPVDGDELAAAILDYKFRVENLLNTASKTPAQFRHLCMRLNQCLQDLPEDIGVSRGDLEAKSRLTAKTTVKTLSFSRLITMLAKERGSITLDNSGNLRRILDSEQLDAFDKAIAEKDTTGWAKQKCQLILKYYQVLPFLHMKGGTAHATSYLSFKMEIDVTLPDQTSVSFTRTLTNLELLGFGGPNEKSFPMTFRWPEG